MSRFYVTGAGGFVGAFLRQRIEADYGPEAFIAMPSEMDIRDEAALTRSLANAKPDYVVHLAAQSFVPAAFEDPRGTFDVNVFGTLSLLAALRATDFSGRMLFVGSGDMYGLVPEDEQPVAEHRALKPRNPYAVSKVAAEALCYQWTQTEKLDIVMARPFNHIGPGQDARFAVADFAMQIARMAKAGEPAVLTAGDVDAARDFTDVRDIVSAYLALLAQGRSGETYNVCSGTSHTLRELIDGLAAIAGIEVRIERDPARFRPTEQKRVCGDPSKLRQDTGWVPEIALQQTLQDTLDHWLHRTP